MKLFVDSNDAGEVRELGARGRVVGVMVRRGRNGVAGADWPAQVAALAGLLPGPVIADVAPGDQPAMLQSARELGALAANVIVRLPMSVDGVEVARACAAAGIKTSVGPCVTPVQAVMAAKAGAAFVETPLGATAGDINEEKDQVRKMVANLRMYGFAAEVVAGPVRNADQIVDAALVGAHVAAAPHDVLADLGGRAGGAGTDPLSPSG